jgi:hypothetical protein
MTRDIVKTLRTQAQLFRQMKNPAQGDILARAADEMEGLRAELAALKAASVHIYNSGYQAGHHYTVEGGYTDIHSSDMDSYHADEVAELLADLCGEG